MNLKHRLPLMTVTFTSVLCVVISIFSLKSGQFIVFQNLYYIPIIISCFYYKKQGFAISVALTCIYLFLIIAFTNDTMIIRDAAIRVILFILIAAIITALSIDRAKLEEKLNNQLEFITTLLNTIPSPVFYKDTAGKYLGCNRAFETYYGKSREEIIGKSVYDMAPTEIACKYAEKDQELFEHPGSQVYEWKVVTVDGSVKEVIFNKATFTDSRANIAGLIGVILDITERKQAAEALRESEDKFRNIFENNSSAMAIIEKDTTISMVNKEYCKVSLYEEKDVIGKRWTAQIPPEDLDRLKEYNRKRLIDPKSAPDNYEFTFYRKDGKIRYSLMSVAIIPTTQQIVCSFVDITERKQAETERERLIAELQNAVEQIKTLRGIVPICASCKKIRDDKGYWQQVEAYVSSHTEAQFSHGICPDCMKELYPEFYEDKDTDPKLL